MIIESAFHGVVESFDSPVRGEPEYVADAEAEAPALPGRVAFVSLDGSVLGSVETAAAPKADAVLLGERVFVRAGAAFREVTSVSGSLR